MKKYVLFFIILFTQFSLNAQTEYIDISKIGMLKTSTMAIYNDDVNYNDLEVFRLNIFSNPSYDTRNEFYYKNHPWNNRAKYKLDFFLICFLLP